MSGDNGSSPVSSLQCPQLQVALTVEYLRPDGGVRRTVRHPRAGLSLRRCGPARLALTVEADKHSFNLPLQQLQLHRRFVREGRATVTLSEVRLLVSNAPPSQLLAFLRVMSAKLALSQRGRPAAAADRLQLAGGRSQLDEVSPLTAAQMAQLTAGSAKATAAGGLRARDVNVQLTPTSAADSCRTPKSRRRPPADDGTPNQGSANKRAAISRYLCPVRITKEQRAVLEVAVSSRNIFFTGSAGTGKSFLLQRVIDALPPDCTFVTASTGAAACHLQGTTLHAFAGIGAGSAPLERCIELARRPAVLQQWKRCSHLIIDEISMVDAQLFQKLEAVARQVRGNDLPFGGIHLILCGDFLQLPPVVSASDIKAGKPRFCFETAAWRRCVDVTHELRQIHRQDDPQFVQILQNIRLGRCTDAQTERLQQTASNNINTAGGLLATRLCTHRADVSQINSVQLQSLPGRERVYVAEDSGSSVVLNTVTPADQQLRLKPGAQVMLTRNTDLRAGLVNGARGYVVGFKTSQPFGGTAELPEVEFACGVRVLVTPERWTVKRSGGGGGGGASDVHRRQLPLRLAWAFSIHKSQGMTLDCVEMSLSRSFEPGQVYVALSRARNLRSLRVLDFKRSCVRAHPTVLQFYRDSGLVRIPPTSSSQGSTASSSQDSSQT